MSEVSIAIDELVEWASPLSRDMGDLGGLRTIRRTMEDERATLDRVRAAVASVRGRYVHPDQLESAVMTAFDEIARLVEHA